jgi:hypothetical protein
MRNEVELQKNHEKLDFGESNRHPNQVENMFKGLVYCEMASWFIFAQPVSTDWQIGQHDAFTISQ